MNVHVTVWLEKDKYTALHDLAQRSGVTISEYLRAIIIDAIAEETIAKTRRRKQ